MTLAMAPEQVEEAQMRAAGEVEVGTLQGGLPYMAFGTGEPLIMFRGAMPVNEIPTGIARWAELRSYGAFADRFRVYAVGHEPNPRTGSTMSDLVSPYARAIRSRFDGPVRVAGWSTGGSMALQFAIDHPGLVERLAIAAAACRLGPIGKAVQMRYVELLEAGQRRAAAAAVAPLFTKSPLTERLAAGMMWLAAPLETIDVADLTTVMRAEDLFAAEADLCRISAPVLVIAGGEDRVYPLELARLTADLIPAGRLMVYEHAGHTQTLEDRRLADDVKAFLLASRGSLLEPTPHG